ncbi:hypothetical protein KFE80_00350 [bacterium SCSIO 12696]|nr:hypothetical protein KFE80_00350 [bacterium SCSIO 12696]
MDRKAQLTDLKRELENLVAVLREDEGCTWLSHFERCLDKTDQLIESGFEQNQLSELSVSVRSVYGGMGSFNDYVPPQSAWGTDRFSNNVWEAAMALKVIGEY